MEKGQSKKQRGSPTKKGGGGDASPTKVVKDAAPKEEKEQEAPKGVESPGADAPASAPQQRELPVGAVGDEGAGEMGSPTEGAEGSSWSGWFTSTINSAKEKSNEMLQYLKHDLTEFTETVSEAGRDLKDKLKIEENAKQAASVVGERMNVVLEQMSTIFGVGPEDEDEEVVVGRSGRLVVDRVQAKIYSLALDESVFTKDPEDVEAYEKWLSHFDFEKKSDEIAELLSANPHLQLQYSQLVPEKVTHLAFWHMFYYRVQLIFDEEAQHKANEKLKRTKSSEKEGSSGKASPFGEASGAGGDPGMVEISEEDQKRLLAEYEEELKKCDEGKNSRRSSGTQLSSSSSGSFAFVTRDPDTDELKVE